MLTQFDEHSQAGLSYTSRYGFNGFYSLAQTFESAAYHDDLNTIIELHKPLCKLIENGDIKTIIDGLASAGQQGENGFLHLATALKYAALKGNTGAVSTLAKIICSLADNDKSPTAALALTQVNPRTHTHAICHLIEALENTHVKNNPKIAMELCDTLSQLTQLIKKSGIESRIDTDKIKTLIESVQEKRSPSQQPHALEFLNTARSFLSRTLLGKRQPGYTQDETELEPKNPWLPNQSAAEPTCLPPSSSSSSSSSSSQSPTDSDQETNGYNHCRPK